MADHAKLIKFVDAALTNPLHPLYRFNQLSVLQKYAINVRVLEAITPEQFMTDYPHEAAKLEEVMKLVEADPTLAGELVPAADKVELERKLAEAQTALTARDAEIAQLKAAQPAAGE